MFNVHQSQLDELARQGTESFEARLRATLESATPGGDVGQKLPEAIAFARSVGLSSEQDIARFAAVACQTPLAGLPPAALSNLKAYGKDPAQKVAAFEQWAAQSGVTPARLPMDAFSSSKPGSTVQPCPLQPKKIEHWLEIELIGEDGLPIPWAAYRVVLPTGEVTEGYLDGQGYARFEHLERDGTCEVKFPELDKDALSFIESVGPRAAPGAATA